MIKILDIRKLKRGARILVETTGEVYELTVGTPERSVVLMASDVRFEQRDKFVLLGSFHSDTGDLLSHGIAEGWCMRLKPGRAPGGRANIITTGPTICVTVTVDDIVSELWSDDD